MNKDEVKIKTDTFEEEWKGAKSIESKFYIQDTHDKNPVGWIALDFNRKFFREKDVKIMIKHIEDEIGNLIKCYIKRSR